MKTRILLLISLSVFLYKCTTPVEPQSPIWGVEFSTESAIPLAQGSIEKENAGVQVIYIVNSGYLMEGDGGLNTISFTFENGESMQLIVTKKTANYNCNFPGNETENQIVSAIFNGDTLALKESSISIQPHLEENKLHILTDMHTVAAGDFNGTLTRIPLLKNQP
jgi:hypothetical protein